jgi:outer membrane protein TolC
MSRGLNRLFALLALVALTLGGLFLAGCAVDQKAEVATYRKVLDADAPAPKAYDAAAPLSLPEALTLARVHNEHLAIRGEDYLQALIDKDRAAANFLPTVSFAPTYMRQKPTKVGGGNPLISQFVPNETVDTPFHAGLNISPLADAANVGRAQSSAEAMRSRLLDLKASVLLDVAATYYQILRTTEQLHVLENSVGVQQKRLDDAQARRKAGTALPLEVAQIRAQLAHTRALLIRSRNDQRNGRATLAFLIGVHQVDGSLTDQLTVPAQTPDTDHLVTLANENREDLKATAAQIEAAVRNVQRAWGRYFPSISLDFDYYLSRQTFPPDVNWMGLVRLHVPIFQAGMVHADVRTSWSQLRQAQLDRSLVRRQVLKEVRMAQDDLQSSHDQLTQLQDQVDAAQEALDRSEQQYAAGFATNLDRLVAQDNLLSAQLDLASQRLAYKLDYLRLLRVVGQLDETAGADPASLSMTSPESK